MRRVRPGALVLLAGIFAAVTLGKSVEVAAVVAESKPPKVSKPDQLEATRSENADGTRLPPETGQRQMAGLVECNTPSLDDAFGRALAERAAVLDERETALQRMRDEVAAALQALQTERARLLEAEGAKDEKAEAQIERLVSLYETMKPKAAAAIFQEMDVTVAARLLARMEREQASFVLGSMEPRRAYALTVALSNELLARLDARTGNAEGG